MLHAVVSNFFHDSLEFADLMQVARLGLHEAAMSFDPAKSSSFTGYANMCIRRQVITAVRTAQRHKHEVLTEARSLSKPLADGGGELADVVPLREPGPAEQVLQRERLREVIVGLATRCTDFESVCTMRVANGDTYRQIAAELDVTEKSIDNALFRARRKLAA